MCEGMRTSLKKAGNMDRRFYTQVLRSSAMGHSIITTDSEKIETLACLMLVTGDYRSAGGGVVQERFLNSDKF